jgi:hypothetical protein
MKVIQGLLCYTAVAALLLCPVQAQMLQVDDIHEPWSAMLMKYVDDQGLVNYSKWSKNIGELQDYLNVISQNPPSDNWKKDESFAYWINAYNAFTIKLILDHYPVTSITDIDHGNPWDKEWIDIGHNTYSLNHIEHQILRNEFSDPRFHFAINCAALSCPPLFNRAFTSENLDMQLDARTEQFINHTAYNILEPGKLELSMIFKWYASDFGDVTSYVDRYTPKTIKPGVPISYVKYDWALNGY